MIKKITCLNLYTDGSLQSMRYGAFSYLIADSGNNKLHVSTTSLLDKSIPYLELQAILEGLIYIDTKLKKDKEDISVNVYSDSNYCVKCINTNTEIWSKNNWKKVNGEEIKHEEEWKKMFLLRNKLEVAAFHVKSHTNIKNIVYDRNREVDKLCYNAALKLKKKEDIFR